MIDGVILPLMSPPTALEKPTSDDSEDDDFDLVARRQPTLPRRRSHDLLTRYLVALEERPIITKAISCALCGAVGSLIGSYRNGVGERLGPRVKGRSKGVDWIDVISYAAYGAIIGGPLGHYWDQWLMEHGPESPSRAMLLDQLIAQPPRLLFLLTFLDVSRSAVSAIPSALRTSWSKLSPSVAASWSFWPVTVYLLLKFAKKKRHRIMGMNICSVVWAGYIARRRASSRSAG